MAISADIGVSMRVAQRDIMGRFTESIPHRTEAALKEIGREGLKVAETIAPKMAPHMDYRLATATQVEWVVRHPAWNIIEGGAVPHSIGRPGQVLHNKVEEFGPVRGPVAHPGVRGLHYLAGSYAAMSQRSLGIFAKYFAI